MQRTKTGRRSDWPSLRNYYKPTEYISTCRYGARFLKRVSQRRVMEMSQVAVHSESNQLSSSSDSIEGIINEKPSVAIILPTYCEAGNIGNLIREIKGLIQDSLIVVVDDSSDDGTASIVESLQTEYDSILCFKRPSKLGLGTAITDGFNLVLSLRNPPDYIITMDADYSHNPQSLPRLLDSGKRGHDLVIGSRYMKDSRIIGWPSVRRLISRVANLLASTMVAMQIRDCTSGYRCYSRNYIENVIRHLHSQTYEIQIETVKQAWIGRFRVEEIPIVFKSRKKGKSKLTKAEFKSFLSYIIREKFA